MRINYYAQKHPNARGLSSMLKLGAAFTVLVLMPMSASAQTNAEIGRIHITFLKAGHGSGSGYLFYQGQKYGLSVSSTKVGRVWLTAIDLIGTAANLRKPADIIGTYSADPGAAIIRRAKLARLENSKGVVLEIRAVNLSRWFTLDLSRMTLKSLGWQPTE